MVVPVITMAVVTSTRTASVTIVPMRLFASSARITVPAKRQNRASVLTVPTYQRARRVTAMGRVMLPRVANVTTVRMKRVALISVMTMVPAIPVKPANAVIVRGVPAARAALMMATVVPPKRASVTTVRTCRRASHVTTTMCVMAVNRVVAVTVPISNGV